MRKLLVAALAAFLLFSAGDTSGTVNLTTNITVPNITKWKVVKYVDNYDETPPYAVVTVKILGSGSLLFGIYNLIIQDSPNWSTQLTKTTVPISYMDIISVNRQAAIVGAYTGVVAAYDNTSGSHNVKKQAVELALLTYGILDSSFSGSQ